MMDVAAARDGPSELLQKTTPQYLRHPRVAPHAPPPPPVIPTIQPSPPLNFSAS